MSAQWQDTNTAAELVGVTAARLRKLKRAGWLKFGLHYRSMSDPSSIKPRLQFNVEKIVELLGTERHKWKQYSVEKTA
jgi:hypothetical protein